MLYLRETDIEKSPDGFIDVLSNLHQLLIKIDGIFCLKQLLMDSILDKSKDVGDQSLDQSCEGRPKAVPCLPEFPSDRKWNCEEKATQTMDNNSPDESLDNSHEQPPDGSPDKASDKPSEESSDEPSDRSYHGEDSSTSYSSDDTEPIDIRESEEYIKSSDKERQRLIRKYDRINKRGAKTRLRRKIKAGKKAWALERMDKSRCKDLSTSNWVRGPVFETEALRVQQCRAAEDRARNLSRADGRKWSDNDQMALEFRRVNEDYIKLLVELSRWEHKRHESRVTLQYRANEVTKLMRIFDGQWREAYERIGDNLMKLKEKKLYPAEHEIRGLDIEKEQKAVDENVRSEKWPKTQRPPTKKPGAHPTLAAKPERKPAKTQQQNPTPQKLRRSRRLSEKTRA